MSYRYINVKSLLKRITKRDKLFNGNYTVDPYRNCEFRCSYCDSSLEETIFIKVNAPDVLERELKEVKRGTIILGSVNDPYQSIERKTCLTREILKVIKNYNFNCHILTKSDLVMRDIDILSEIQNCLVTISLISLDDNVTGTFEKNAPNVKKRLETVDKLYKQGIKAGIALIPLLPYIVEEEIEEIVNAAKNYNAQYILYEHLELKGDQRNHFFNTLKNFKQDLVEKYELLYKNSLKPSKDYIEKIEEKIEYVIKKHNIKNKCD